MPLRDHFRPPVTRQSPWEPVHAMWPAIIVQKLFSLLPEGFQAAPRVHLGDYFEIDIGSFESRNGSRTTLRPNGNGGIAVMEPDLSLETDTADVSEYEVLLYDLDADRRLVAAIEIISPANKDRPRHRAQFVSKCAALLSQQVCVVLVDIVTVRQTNLYLELLEQLELSDPGMTESDDGIYAACCRTRRTETKTIYDIWRRPLKIGTALPTLPLWLRENYSVPLNLEESYEETCRLLKIK